MKNLPKSAFHKCLNCWQNSLDIKIKKKFGWRVTLVARWPQWYMQIIRSCVYWFHFLGVKFLFHLQSPRSFLKMFHGTTAKLTVIYTNRIKLILTVWRKSQCWRKSQWNLSSTLKHNILYIYSIYAPPPPPPVLTRKVNIKPVPREVFYFQKQFTFWDY